MCRKIGNHRVEYKDPIYLMDHPSNMQIGLCWYQKGQQQVDLQSYRSFETMIALASMTYIIDFDAYKLHMGDEKVFNDFIMNDRVLHFTHDRGCLLFKSIFIYFLLMIIYEHKFFK